MRLQSCGQNVIEGCVKSSMLYLCHLKEQYTKQS